MALQVYVQFFMSRKSPWRKYFSCAFKFSLVILCIVLLTGEFGCFLWASLNWRIPQASTNSLNLLLVSDTQIQGYHDERSGILGYVTRLDADWYLKKAFSLALASFSPDAIIHLGDVFDEGYIANNDEFLEYKARHERIFKTPEGIAKIYVPGDNDVGGEGLDSITKDAVSRFSTHFGPVNEVINLKYFQIVKVNYLSFLRRRHFRNERWVWNETMTFINELPSKLDREKTTVLIGHVPLRFINKKNKDQLTRLIHAVRPSYVFSGHIHEAAMFYHKFGSLNFVEYVVPTCSYRMGTDKMGTAVAVLAPDDSIKYSILRLPRRYPFFWLYLAALGLCTVLAIPWLVVFIVRAVSRALGRKNRPCFAVKEL